MTTKQMDDMENARRAPKIRHSATLPLPATAGDLTALLAKIPASAQITATNTPGDRPFESGTSTLTITWRT